MAWRVGDDELALVGREEPVGDVDGDALFTLGRQTIYEQGEIELASSRAHLLRVGSECRELILEDHLGLVQQAADERGLAVIDTTARDEAEQSLLLERAQITLDSSG